VRGSSLRPLLVTAVYALALAIALVAPTSAPHPHRGWLRDVEKGGRRFAFDVVANVAVFVPLGAGLCYSARRLGLGAGTALAGSVLVAGAFSLTMESIQYLLPYRYSSIVDVATNTVGATLGALAVTLAQRDSKSPGARRQT
jgi:glycopeptide antibiotics resistance protein